MNQKSEHKAFIGKRLEWVRSRLGLTRAEVEENTGISAARLASYERGRIPLQVEAGLRLCRAYNANPYFIDGFEAFWKGHCFEVERSAGKGGFKYFSDLVEAEWKKLGPNAYAESVINRMSHFEGVARDQLRAMAELMSTIRRAAEEVDPQKRSDALKEVSRLADRIETPLHATSFSILTDFNDLQDTIWGLTLRALRSEPVEEEKAPGRTRPLPLSPPRPEAEYS